MVLFFGFRLYDLQIVSTGGKVDNTKTFTTVTRVKAARGDILDRHGNVLVTNRASYDLEDIKTKAQAMGLDPKSELQTLSVEVTVPVPETEPTRMEEIRFFLEGLFA